MSVLTRCCDGSKSHRDLYLYELKACYGEVASLFKPERWSRVLLTESSSTLVNRLHPVHSPGLFFIQICNKCIP